MGKVRWKGDGGGCEKRCDLVVLTPRSSPAPLHSSPAAALTPHTAHTATVSAARLHVLLLALLSFCLLFSPTAVMSSPLPSPSDLSAVSQCVSVPSHTPRLLSLTYQSALLSSLPVTQPAIQFPSYTSNGWTGSSALLPVSCVISSLPSPTSSVTLYENVGGVRGAAVVSAPHTLPSLDVWVLGSTGSAADNFSFFVQSSLGSSVLGDVVVNVSSLYQPPSLTSQSVTVATFRNSLAYLPLDAHIRVTRQPPQSSSPPVVYSFPSLPSQGVLYGLPASFVSRLPLLAPLLDAVDPFNPLSFSLPALLPSGDISEQVDSELSRWLIPLSVASIVDGSGMLLVYRSNASSAASMSDSFQVSVDDGQSTMPGTSLTVNVQLLTRDQVVSSPPASLNFVVAAYSSGQLTLPCVQSVAPISQCRISLLELPNTGQVSTNGSVLGRVPHPLVNNTLVFTPTNDSITAEQTTELTYVAYNGVAISPVYTLTVTIQPAPAPPSCTSFSVESIDYAEVLVRLTASSPYANSSYQAVISSLPDSAVGSLFTSDERAAITSAPFFISPSSSSPQLIFSPNVAAASSSSSSSSSTSFTYHVVDQTSLLSCTPSTVTVLLGTTPPPPFVPIPSFTIQTTQVDPVVVTLSAASVATGPVVANLTSLPYNGTLYQYQSLPSHLLYPRISALLTSLLTSSMSWTSADSPSSLLCANSSYTVLYDNVSATVQSACLTSAAVSCMPPSIMSELVAVTATSSIVLDPLLRLLYVPARFAVSDSFAYTVSAPPSSVSGGSLSSTPTTANTGWVTMQITSMQSPPSPLPPVASSTSPLSRYLPTLAPYQLAQYQDDTLSITLRANSGYPESSNPPTSLSFYVSRLPVNGTLYYQNASCGGCWTPIPPLFSPSLDQTAPLETGWSLTFIPAAGETGASTVGYLYASFDFFVVDPVLGSCPPASVAVFVYPPLLWPSCVSQSMQAIRGVQLTIALGNWVDLSSTIIIHSLPLHGLLYQSTAEGQVSTLIWSGETAVSDSLLKLVYVPYVSSLSPSDFDVFTYGVYNSSTQLLSLPCTINISLVDVQPLPVATPLIVNTTENVAISFSLACSVPPCVYSLLTLPASGQLSEVLTMGNITNTTVLTSTGALQGSGQLQFAPIDYDSGDPINYNYYSNFTYIALPASSTSNLSPYSSPPWSQPALVRLQVSQVNYAPMFTNQNLTMPGDSYLVVSLAANNSKSQPAVAYTVTIASLPARGMLYQYTAQSGTSPIGAPIGGGLGESWQVEELDINGDLDSGTNVVFVPTEFEHGAPYANFSFYATDETAIDGKTAVFNVTVNVTPRNHAPVATPLSFTIDGSGGNQMVSINLQDAAVDVDGDEIFYSVTSWPSKGVLWSCERLPLPPPSDTGDDGGDDQQETDNNNCQPTGASTIYPYDLSPVATLNLSSLHHLLQQRRQFVGWRQCDGHCELDCRDCYTAVRLAAQCHQFQPALLARQLCGLLSLPQLHLHYLRRSLGQHVLLHHCAATLPTRQLAQHMAVQRPALPQLSNWRAVFDGRYVPAVPYARLLADADWRVGCGKGRRHGVRAVSSRLCLSGWRAGCMCDWL